MRTHIVISLIFVVFFSSFTISLGANKNLKKLLIEGLQGHPELFQLVELEKASPTDFKIELGESVLTLDGGDKFDGFRFKAPEGADQLSLVWYFNAPSNWGEWYLCPVKGEYKESFRSWFNGDKLYENFDKADEGNRVRTLQTLDAGYFEPGEEYIMWFRERGEGDNRLSGRLSFATIEGNWEHQEIEEELGLSPMPVEAQVKNLKSRGGEILLDEEFFTNGYAASRMDSVFFGLRRSKQMRGGFFVTIQTAVPACDTNPSLLEIQERYGEPDFIQTGLERGAVVEHAGGGVDYDPNIVTYFYDYFGFEVNKDDPNKIVERVMTHAHDFSVFTPKDEQASFAQVGMKNLTVFFDKGKEVGRAYYFLEGGKEPLCITVPPVGSYRRGGEVLEYLGEEKWTRINYFEDESVARRISFENHRMNGKSEGFHRNGQRSFVASYKDGELDGKLVQYSEEGDVLEEKVFSKGKPQQEAS